MSFFEWFYFLFSFYHMHLWDKIEVHIGRITYYKRCQWCEELGDEHSDYYGF